MFCIKIIIRRMEETFKTAEATEPRTLNFLEEIIEADLASGKYNSIITRFPPEPNGISERSAFKTDMAKIYVTKTNKEGVQS